MAKINEKTGLVENKYICCEDSELNEIHVYNIDINRDEEHKEVIIKHNLGWANYIRIYKSEYLEYTDDSLEGQCKRLKAYIDIDNNWTPNAYVLSLTDFIDRFCDHHNMIATEDTCEFGDTPQEALRNYMLMKLNEDENEKNIPELYVRKNNKFVYLNDFISDEEKWNELTSNYDVYTYGADGWYNKEPVMEILFKKGE